MASICEHGQNFREYLNPFVEPGIEPPTVEEVGLLRFHPRKLEGADILLAPETNYLRQRLHRLAEVAPEPTPDLIIFNPTRKS